MKKLLLVLLALFSLYSCNEEKKPSFKIGKYLYQDKFGTLHIEDNCFQLFVTEDSARGVKRIPSRGFDPALLNNTCNHCISDEAYDSLKTMSGMKIPTGIKWENTKQLGL